MVGNMICIFIAGAYNGVTKRKPKLFKGFTGHGKILRTENSNKEVVTGEKTDSGFTFSLSGLGIGLLLAVTLYIFGEVVAHIIPGLHPYVWIILGAAALKIFNILPSRLEKAAGDWYEFMSIAFVPAVLVAISAGMIDFNKVLAIVTDPTYLSLTVITVILAAVGAGFVGLLVGFYFVESSIAAGLGMADMGGSGDVAVLSASGRMELMPFLQISSRIGGAIMLIILSILAPLLL